MDQFFYPTTTGTSSSHTVTYGDLTTSNYKFTLPDSTIVPTPEHKPMCQVLGHHMSQEVEWADSGVFGKCETCGVMIHGRRIPGGFAVEKLRELVHSTLGEESALEDLAAEVLRMQALIDAEDRALEEARSLLDLARRKIAQRALPNFE